MINIEVPEDEFVFKGAVGLRSEVNTYLFDNDLPEDSDWKMYYIKNGEKVLVAGFIKNSS